MNHKFQNKKKVNKNLQFIIRNEKKYKKYKKYKNITIQIKIL